MQPNHQPNKSQIERVDPDTIAFMLSNGFSVDDNWFQWMQKQRHPAKPAH